MEINCAHTRVVKLTELKPHPGNENKHSEKQVQVLAKVIAKNGQRSPIVVSSRSGYITKGHGRLKAITLLGWEQAAVDFQDYTDELAELNDRVADNEIARYAEFDNEMFEANLSLLDVDLGEVDYEEFGLIDYEIEEDSEGEGSFDEPSSLSDNFLIPPFSTFDTRQGYWQARKREWVGLGMQSELGRGEELVSKKSEIKYGSKVPKVGAVCESMAPSTSIFDPVLAEVCYTWFCPPGGTIVDPFAGGSVRGVVASKLGRQYLGHELRAEQVESNRQQADELCVDPMPVWNVGDSRYIDKSFADIKTDLLFTCPPYADLEVYSDDPADISNMDYPEFLKVYREIIAKSCSLLKDDAFACVVVGEVRRKDGIYHNFVGDTINAFIDAGLSYYNEIILINQSGTAAMRAAKLINASRKVVKTHQNVLVFVKGDAKKATLRCGEIEVMDVVDVEESV